MCRVGAGSPMVPSPGKGLGHRPDGSVTAVCGGALERKRSLPWRFQGPCGLRLVPHSVLAVCMAGGSVRGVLGRGCKWRDLLVNPGW